MYGQKPSRTTANATVLLWVMTRKKNDAGENLHRYGLSGLNRK